MSFAFLPNKARKKSGAGASLAALAGSEAEKVLRFHRSFPEYSQTPLHALPRLAAHLGLGSIHLKDESYRFGLNAFKVLGGTYAMGRWLAQRLGSDIDTLGKAELCSGAVREALGPITFTSATDGNHGRGVAWTAQQLGQKAVIYMPKGAAKSRVDNILATGAECHVTDLNYDDAVRLADDTARKNGWVMVQDTAWEGYEEIPTWIMQGYMTLMVEAFSQMRDAGSQPPTHLLLQAGVGSFAGAALGYLVNVMGDAYPTTLIVEPNQSDCIYRSARAADGKPHAVTGDLSTLMAGLACGEPNTVSWGVLRDYAHAYLSCQDYVAANGMRILAAPLAGDPGVIAGESGAAPLGALEYIMTRPNARELKTMLGLTASSRVLVVSTEGDTSPDTWRDVVWYGHWQDGEEK